MSSSQIPALNALPGPHSVARTVLDNGLVLLVRENRAAPVVTLQGSLSAGAQDEPANRAGLAAFTAAMLSRGSLHHDYSAFNEAVESVGGNLTFGADTHSTDFSLACLSEDFAGLVAVLADALRQPHFADEHVERVRQQRLVYIQERDQDTSSVASLHFHEMLYGRHHPYGRSTSGYLDTIGALTHNEVVEFHRGFYTPTSAAIVIAGDISAGAAKDLVERYFGDWRGPAPAPAAAAPRFLAVGKRDVVKMPGKVQSDLVIGAPGIARDHPDFYALRVANAILGQFGMMGRLGERVREEQGLAYYAYSGITAERAGGVWMAAAGVNPAHVEQAAASILAEFTALGSELVSPEELADSQAFLTGILPLTLETNDGVANALLGMEWYHLGLDYLQRYYDLIYSVTAEDVLRVAATYLSPERCCTVIAGPSSDGASDNSDN
ncbi:MAG: insulinase family protein [Anaerolineales bacterium]|nr:insulinase family protein [Anaerolineales bacterium]